jgi:hypothetical protein
MQWAIDWLRTVPLWQAALVFLAEPLSRGVATFVRLRR